MIAAASSALAEILKGTGLTPEQIDGAKVRRPAPHPAPTAPAPSATPPRPSSPKASGQPVTPPRPDAGVPVELRERPQFPSPQPAPEVVPPTREAQGAQESQRTKRVTPKTKDRGIAARYPNPRTETLTYAAPPATFSNFIEDPRPKIRLRGDNRLLSDVASELAPHLAYVLYRRNGEVVEYRDGSLYSCSAQRFRTLVEKHAIFYRVRSANESTVQVSTTLDEADARGILVSPQFLERLKPLRHLNKVRLPVIRLNGRVELLPQGYDAEAATLTDAEADYSEDMSFADAVETVCDLFGEFQFADRERSEAVAVAALLGLYAKQLVKPGELRPAFTFAKNAEGSGATCLVQSCVIPVLGDLPIGSKAKDDDEQRKSLTSAIRTGQDVVFLDNLKGQLNSPALEAFVSAPVWTDRLLGANEVVTGPNTATVFITANGLLVTPDWRRRSLFVQLHLSVERAEDRVFKRPLSAPVLREMRPKILAACWALVRYWDKQSRPAPSRSHSAFPAWAAVIGGIVETAGFACPFTTANVAIVADEDGLAMRGLVAEMIPGTAYTSAEIVNLCRRHNLFEALIGASDADMGRAQRSAFGKLLARYDDRQVSDLKFHITGTGHGKRFQVLRAGDSQARPLPGTEADAGTSLADGQADVGKSAPENKFLDVEV